MTCEECTHKSVCYRVHSIQSDYARKCGDFVSGYKILESEPTADVLWELRAEIEELDGKYLIGDCAIYGEKSSPKYVRLWEVLQIIDKYMEGE